ncbi:hypothetical protein JTB14_019356 [Gonioctena quinquepunctata]|nr:hypothetical protein JTB14_019356 [Gonioctena quinquepunctata]
MYSATLAPPSQPYSAPGLRRQDALLLEYKKIMENPNLPVHDTMDATLRERLKYRNPSMKTARFLQGNNFSMESEWENQWNEAA